MEKLLKHGLAVALVLADQVLKYLTRAQILIHDYGWFAFTHVTNTGALFGMFQDNNAFFIVLSIVALAFLVWHYEDTVAFNLIIAGVIGNLIDRVIFGHVTDMLNFKIWPVFNLADACIVTGVAILVFREFYENSSYSSNPSK